MIAWWTGGAFVLYFADAPTLVKQLLLFQAPSIAYIWIGILTFTTYLFAGHMREQTCIYICPWPRIQAAMTDEWALNVSYEQTRGEPRMSVKKAEAARTKGLAAGDCIDCFQCVAVCPTGVDIRDGSQLGCIQCGLCIDACDNVMKEIGRPPRLIAYDTDINIARRPQGLPPIYKPIRVRTLIYPAIIALVGGLMVWKLATRSDLGIDVLHDRNPMSIPMADGGVRNGYTIRILNKKPDQRHVKLSVSGAPGLQLKIMDAPTPTEATVSPELHAGAARHRRRSGRRGSAAIGRCDLHRPGRRRQGDNDQEGSFLPQRLAFPHPNPPHEGEGSHLRAGRGSPGRALVFSISAERRFCGRLGPCGKSTCFSVFSSSARWLSAGPGR